MKISKLHLNRILIFTTMFAMTSCGLFNVKKYETIKLNRANSTLNLVETGSTTGEVITPDEMKFTYTNYLLNKTFMNAHAYIPSPVVGEAAMTIKVLVPLIHFSDSYLITAVQRGIIEDKIRAAFEGNTQFLNVKDFYKKASNNLINFEFVYTDWYSAGSSSQCTNEQKTYSIVDNVVKNGTINGNPIDSKEFDSNKDGFIDAIYAVYDVHNYVESHDNNDNLWAYTLDNSNVVRNKENPVARNFSWASCDFLDKGYGDGDTMVDPHTFIHETGHLFGLFDYYDYNKNSSPICALDMMDLNTCDLNAYSRLILGWMKPYIVYGNATINLNEVKNKKSCIVIVSDKSTLTKEKSTGKYLFNPFNEYMLVEYFDFDSLPNNIDLVSGYSPAKLDGLTSYTTSGYKIYHVNSPQLLASKQENTTNYEFYYSHEPVEKKNTYFLNIISNTTKGSTKRAETDLFNVLEITYDDPEFDYFNEIALIAKQTVNENSYRSLYVHKNEGDELKIEKPSNNFLYFKGDTFDSKNYSNYFIHGKNDNGVILDNNDTFSTVINFN